MTNEADKTYAAITAPRAPRDVEWGDFIAMWRERAESVSEESGDRLAVKMSGHRVVFRRQHDGLVGIEDVERARHLLRSRPEDRGSGSVLAVVIDEERARILEFDLDAQKVDLDDHHDVHDGDPRAHHLRTVERHTGRDDKQDLTHFFDELAEELAQHDAGERFVVIGHGRGTSDAAEGFVERLRAHHPLVAGQVAGVVGADLSAITDDGIERIATEVLRA